MEAVFGEAKTALRHSAAAMRHQITELSERIHAFPHPTGAAMENDMVADAALWAIFAASIALIACGCRLTRPAPKRVEQPSQRDIDQAA